MKRKEHSRRRGSSPLKEQLLYRRAMAVMSIQVFPQCHDMPSYPVCPRCGRTMEREYLAFCSRCGQKLDWRRYDCAKIIYVEPNHDIIFEENSIRSH